METVPGNMGRFRKTWADIWKRFPETWGDMRKQEDSAGDDLVTGTFP